MIRVDTGEWLDGFSKFLGKSSGYVAKLRGVLESLCLDLRLDFNKVKMHILRMPMPDMSFLIAQKYNYAVCSDLKLFSFYGVNRHLLSDLCVWHMSMTTIS